MRYFLLITCFITNLLSAAPDTFIVGTNSEFPPFSYMEKGEIVGFDIDVAKEVANRLGKKVQFKDMPFDALIPDVVLGNVDFVAAGVCITDERAKRVSFTKSYLLEDPLVILSRQPNLVLEDLKGKTVAVVEGFTADIFMSSQPGVNVISLSTQADGFLALKNWRADAFVTASTTVNSFYETQNPSDYYTTIIDTTGETCALVVPKNRPELHAELQKALDGMECDGAMAKLKNKWKVQ